MKDNLEQMWRERFESQDAEFYGGNNLQRDGSGYSSSYVNMKWEIWWEVCMKAQGEFDHLTEKLDHLERFTGVHISDSFSFGGNELCDEIKTLKQELRAEREAVDFYADIENWQLRTLNETGVERGACIRIRKDDSDYITPANRYIGGKLARETKAERTVIS